MVLWNLLGWMQSSMYFDNCFQSVIFRVLIDSAVRINAIFLANHHPGILGTLDHQKYYCTNLIQR
jgi:hypothetical protein